MAIPKGVTANFKTLLKAAENGDLALMECKDALTLEPRYVICAVSRGADNTFAFSPFGHMCSDDNPYDTYMPPEA